MSSAQKSEVSLPIAETGRRSTSMGWKKAWIYLILGLLFLAVGLFWGEYIHSKEIANARAAANSAVAADIYTGSLISAGILFCQTIGAAFIVMGVLNIAIETDDWRKYFEERLRDVVTHSSYLRTLSREQVGKIRNDVLKAHFKDDKIDREDGFLKFFDKQLYDFIGTPYRESLHVILEVSPTDDKRRWQVRDRVRYTCRSVCGSIQKNVRWMSDLECDLSSLKINVIYPGGSNEEGKGEQIVDLNDEQLSKHKEEWRAKLKEKKFKYFEDAIWFKRDYQLDKYKDDDGLIIEQDAVYYVPKDSFQTQVMLVPTKKFDIQIHFPTNAEIQTETMILDSALISKKRGDGWLSISSDTWMLPESGIVWRVFDKNVEPLALLRRGE